MQPSQLYRLGALLLSTIVSVQALSVTPDSECAALCSDGPQSKSKSSNAFRTNSSEITCEDNEFSDSGTGIKFRNCINCLQKSENTWKSESDIAWYLYNVRYAFDVCLFSFPSEADSGTVSSPCNIDGACGKLKGALSKSLLGFNDDNQYDYCAANDSIIDTNAYTWCINCLKSSGSQTYLANFLVALKAGCDQRPKAGELIGLSQQLFTSTVINITDPDTGKVMPGDGGAEYSSMTTGTIVGIAVGCGLAFLGAIGLMVAYCRRQRRRTGEKIDSPTPEQQPPAMGDSAIYGIRKGSYYINHKGTGSTGSYSDSNPYSHSRSISNAEYFDKMEEQRRAGGMPYPYAPSSLNPEGALPAHHAYIPRVASRLSSRSRSPSNPPNFSRPNGTDSYALQTYLSAPEESGSDPNRGSDQSSRGDSREPSPARPDYPGTMPPPPPPPAAKTKVPSLVLPSLSKIRIPKKYSPPQVTVEEPTPVEGTSDPNRDMRISKPLAVFDSRFQDKPLMGGTVLATEAPPSFNSEYLKRREANKSPLLSGHSLIYG